MEAIITLALFFNKWGIILLLVSLGFSLYGQSQYRKGDLAKARKCLKIAAIAAGIMAGSYGVVFLLLRDAFSLMLAVLWGYFAWRDWKNYKILGS